MNLTSDGTRRGRIDRFTRWGLHCRRAAAVMLEIRGLVKEIDPFRWFTQLEYEKEAQKSDLFPSIVYSRFWDL